MRYSVVIPAFNEADNVQPLAEELFRVLGTQPPGAEPDFEVIFVDDGSRDGTADRVAALLPRPGLRLLRHATQAGKSAALRTGTLAAKAPWIVTLDADGQNDPADVPALLAAADTTTGCALVAGIRRRRDDTLSKRIASKLGNGIRQALLRDDCPDTACGLKLIRRDVLLALPYFDTMHRFFPALVRRHGHKVAMVKVNDRARRAGMSKYTNLGRAIVGAYDLIGVTWLLRRTTLPSSIREG